MAVSRKRRLQSDEYRRRENSMVSRWTHPPERNTAEFIGAFRTSPRLAVVDRISTDLSFAPGKLFRIQSDGTETELTRHPFLDFWAYPNPLMEYSSEALWQLQQIYLLLKGEGYFIISWDHQHRPCELWPVPVQWVLNTPYEGQPFYVIRSPNGTVMNVSVDDIFVMKRLNPLDPSLRGLGQAEALADEIEIDEYAAKFQKRFFYNDATPAAIVHLQGATDEQVKRFHAGWMERLKGVFNSHGLITVGGNTTPNVQKLADNMRDMDMLQGRAAMHEACRRHFGVPPEIMGETANSNRATSWNAQIIYNQQVLTPMLAAREKAINQQLVGWFGEDLVWRFDPLVASNEEFDKQLAMDFWNAGLITQNQALEKGGFPSIGDAGEVRKIAFTDMFVRAGDDVVKVTTEAANLQFGTEPPLMEPESEDDDAIEVDGVLVEKSAPIVIHTKNRQRKEVTLQQLLRSEQQAAKESQRAFEIATARFLRQQAADIQRALGGAGKSDADAMRALQDYILPDGGFDVNRWLALPEAEQNALSARFAKELIDWDTQSARLERSFKPIWSQAYKAGAKQMQSLYGLGGVKQPKLSVQAQKHGAQRVVGIQDATKEKIAASVARRIRDGGSTRELADDIMKTMDAPEKRANLIARQETMTSLSNGQFDMMTAGGATDKTWHHHSTTPYARATHIAMNGKTIGIRDWFVFPGGVKLRFPRDPLATGGKKAAGEVIECRCAVTYDFGY
ncbi:MAG: phage portal protein [Oscillospiraceae bacterium]|jgi:HK97 family phage portal protein|nr:phage portal protein [Oscillospiraceae bacterium]